MGLQVCVLEKFNSKADFCRLFKEDHFSILLVNSGAFFIQINDKKITISVNEMLVIPSRTPYAILAMSNQLQICLLSFTTDFVCENSIRRPHIGYLEFFMTKLSPKLCLNSEDVVLLIDLLLLLNSKVLYTESRTFKKEILLFSFNLLLYELAGIYERSSGHLSARHSKKETLMIEFFKILELNCRKQHRVQFYADTLHITSGHLTKILKIVTDKTAKQWIEQAIVLEAKILLENHHLTILWVMEELEFNSLSSFCVFFKRHTKLSPSEYRMRLNSDG